MKFLRALKALTKAHVTRETIEVPMMLNFFNNFKNKKVLDPLSMKEYVGRIFPQQPSFSRLTR